MIKFKHVDGKDKGRIVLYALSTCGWCRKTKKLLSELGIGYDYVDVDQVDDRLSDEIVAAVKKWNPEETYPTIVVEDKRSIINYQEDQIRELAK